MILLDMKQVPEQKFLYIFSCGRRRTPGIFSEEGSMIRGKSGFLFRADIKKLMV
ncbi:Uncharacterized protein dnm_019600 [Desulfonema magnum]|uniref:Uncharacterized protein n=1 Tax=Desulfonema magnum TaxID=45655 RepID=A0A975BIH5_9BACT|nr:Uncharacterized protein dnm_019600 [Desulfonema magnum]